MSKLLEGKFALILGIANRWSLAYAIAQAFSREGATLALTDLVRYTVGIHVQTAGGQVRPHSGYRQQVESGLCDRAGLLARGRHAGIDLSGRAPEGCHRRSFEGSECGRNPAVRRHQG